MKKEYDFSTAKRGAVVSESGKSRITIRIDKDILEWFRRQAHATGGGSYQPMINNALREYINARSSALEATVRRVIRQELAASSKRQAR
jgi:uncharacterized protein (DUF4415 family)